MATFRPEIKQMVKNHRGEYGYYPSVGFRPGPESGPGPFSEGSISHDTIESAFKTLEKELRSNFTPGEDQVVIENFEFDAVEDALRELARRYGLVP